VDSLADRVRTMVHAFDRGDDRRDAVRAIAAEVAILEAEVERLRDENEALRRARLQVRAHDDPILDVRMFGFSFGFTAAELYDLPRDALVDWVTEKFRDGVRAALPTGGGERE
jgi:hypothetical protein